LHLVIHNVTFDCTGDPCDLGPFRSELLRRPPADDDKPGDPEALIKGPAGGPTLSDGGGWIVPADAEGNDFCVERGEPG